MILQVCVHHPVDSSRAGASEEAPVQPPCWASEDGLGSSFRFEGDILRHPTLGPRRMLSGYHCLMVIVIDYSIV